MEAFTIVCSLCLCRNDLVFNGNIFTHLQVIYLTGVQICPVCSLFSCIEYIDLSADVCTRLECVVIDTFKVKCLVGHEVATDECIGHEFEKCQILVSDVAVCVFTKYTLYFLSLHLYFSY